VLAGIAFFAALLAGCDRTKAVEKSPFEVPSATNQLPSQISPTAAASKDSQAPIQGQVDPKEAAQRRDFETKRPGLPYARHRTVSSTLQWDVRYSKGVPVMGKYVLGWNLGVPVFVLVIIYVLFH
jgi:hypothetical protein